MHDDIIEKYPDVLQNLESAIIQAYEEDRSLLDLDVLDMLDTAIRRYTNELQGRTPPPPRLAAKVASAYATLEKMCEWRLGRTPMGGMNDTPEIEAPLPLTVEELLSCLKRVRKSAKFWNDEAGRQGYLDYVSQFV